MSTHRPGRANLVLGALLAATGAARSLAAEPGAPSPAPYDVVRVGDGQTSCTDLASEINQLTRDVAAERATLRSQEEHAARAAQASADNSAMARRAALGGLVHASAFIPFGGGFAALAARSAAMGAAGSAAAAPQASAPVIAPAAAADTPQSQRLALLQGIFGRKAC